MQIVSGQDNHLIVLADKPKVLFVPNQRKNDYNLVEIMGEKFDPFQVYQKGIAPVMVILVLLCVGTLGVGGFYYFNQHQDRVGKTVLNTFSSVATPAPTSIPNPSPSPTPSLTPITKPTSAPKVSAPAAQILFPSPLADATSGHVASPREILDVLNEMRVADGKGSLVLHEGLNQWAAERVNFFLARGDVEDNHEGFTAQAPAKSPILRMGQLGEASLYTQKDTTAYYIIYAFSSSAKHYEGMMQASNKFMGAGLVKDNKGGLYVDLIFGAP